MYKEEADIVTLDLYWNQISTLIPRRELKKTRATSDDHRIRITIDFQSKKNDKSILTINERTLVWSYDESSLGSTLSVFYNKTLIAFAVCTYEARNHFLSEIRKKWFPCVLKESPNKVKTLWHHAIFVKKKLYVLAYGSHFQTIVWRALLKINCGEIRTYLDIANDLNRSGSARAVGTAIGGNPIFFFIPCHRVVRKSGELGGYRWGLGLKKILLDHESTSKVTNRIS